MAKILVVEDDPNLAQVIQITLEIERFVVDCYSTVAEGLMALRTMEYDLVMLDWMLPDATGVELCRTYRASGGNAPILMLTARHDSKDKIESLTAGADDYVVKPFDPGELVARVRALLRRPAVVAPPVVKRGALEIEADTFQVRVHGQPVELLPKEFAILQLLAEHPDRYYTAEAILSKVWPSDVAGSIDSVRTHIKTLRRKLGDESIIENTRNLGYRISSNKG
jgi:DNA-binding response OmpR family regulator